MSPATADTSSRTRGTAEKHHAEHAEFADSLADAARKLQIVRV